MYSIIYLWRGERHRVLQSFTFVEAKLTLLKFKSANWQAWIERE